MCYFESFVYGFDLYSHVDCCPRCLGLLILSFLSSVVLHPAEIWDQLRCRLPLRSIQQKRRMVRFHMGTACVRRWSICPTGSFLVFLLPCLVSGECQVQLALSRFLTLKICRPADISVQSRLRPPHRLYILLSFPGNFVECFLPSVGALGTVSQIRSK